MSNTQEKKLLASQQALFTRIAGKYDLINHLMTGWQDNRWRRYTVNQLQLPPSARLLDIGSGNGQLVMEVHRQYPDSRCIAADLTKAMIDIGQRRTSRTAVRWTGADCSSLPFPGMIFDGVISGFLIRNLKDVDQGIKEQYRVLKPGGRIAVLDTTKPSNHLLTPLIRIYMNKVIPALGSLITGDRTAYNYLADSTENFMRAEEVAAILEAAGFKNVAYKQFLFAMITVYWGEK